MFRCSSVVQMPLYLSGNTCPDVSLVMNGCYQYMFSTKKYHKLSLKILVHYLKQTKNCGLVLDTNYDVCKVDTHPYAVFQVFMYMIIILILYVLRSIPDLSSRFHIIPFCGFQSYRPSLLY